MYATAQIDIARPAGRKLVRELETKKFVKMDYPLPPEIAGQKWFTHDEVFDMVDEILTEHYGVPIKSR